jgi:pilus assembly protein CpaB
MRSKSLALLTLALACGLVASIGISQMMDARNKQGDDGAKTPIFVALTDIGTNEELTPQNIKLEEWPKTIVPQGALTRLEEVEGKRSRMKVYAGEPILLSKLVGANESLGAAKDIPPGYRLAHVHVDSLTGSSNLILPGDRVDVIVFRNPSADTTATAAKIVLQDIKVFAVDTHTETEFTTAKGEQSEPMTAKTFSLLVTPQQAVILHAAAQIGGSVRLALRNPDDDVKVDDNGVNLSDIFGPEKTSDRTAEHKPGDPGPIGWLNQQAGTPPPAPQPPPVTTPNPGPVRSMTVLLGSEIKQVEFPTDGGLPLEQPEEGIAGPDSSPPSGSQLTGENGETEAPPEPQETKPEE